MNDLVEVLRSKSAHDPALRALLKSIDSGKANFRDTAQYSIRYSHQLGNILSENVLDIPPDVRETAAEELLKYGYDDMNTILAEVQKSLDEQAGIHIRPQKADFPSERVRQFTHSLVDTTVTDSVIQRRARAGSETITKSFHDSFIKKNAQFRNDAGLKCYITREGSNCCKWCSEVAGRYEFGSQPSDIFRRHDNCDCTIDYDGQKLRGKLNADGSRSKTWEEIPDADGKYEPKVLSETDARAAEQRNLSQFRGVKINSSSIDNGRGSGIIGSELESLIRYSDNREVSQNIRASLENTISVIPEHLKNRLEQYVPEIIIEENRGYSSFSPDTHRIILDMKNADRDILHELGHAFASMDNLYEDEEFLAVLSDGLNNENWNNVVPLKHPYRDETVYIHISDKFVDPYQGRIYADIFSVDYSEPIDLHFFKEYISVGFDTYFSNPELLKAKDIKLFNYLEGKING